MDYIKIKERKDIFRLGIIDEKDNIVKDEKGEEVCLEFDLADIELPIRYNRCINQINNAKRNLKNQLIIIDKKQDHKGKQMLSANEEAKAKALQLFYKEMEDAMDLFLGKGGTRKYLNGRKPYWTMFEDLSEAIEPFMDKMQLTMTDMAERIKKKYKVQESDVLTND